MALNAKSGKCDSECHTETKARLTSYIIFNYESYMDEMLIFRPIELKTQFSL